MAIVNYIERIVWKSTLLYFSHHLFPLHCVTENLLLIKWLIWSNENKVLPFSRKNKYLDVTALFEIEPEKQATVHVFRRLGAS